MKRCVCILSICCMLFGTCLFYVPVYAEQQPAPGDNWTNVTADDQYLAFKAYMRARDLTLSGSVEGALSTFTSDMYQKLIKRVGLDMNTIQAGIFGVYQDNQWLKFGFSALGINAFNQLCAQFLQDYSITVDEENVDKTLYSGKYITDDNGNSCLAFVLTGQSNQKYSKSQIKYYGSSFYYSAADYLGANIDHTFLFNSHPFRIKTNHNNSSFPLTANLIIYADDSPKLNSLISRGVINSSSQVQWNAYISFAYVESDNTLRANTYCIQDTWPSDYTSYQNLSTPLSFTSTDTGPIDVTSPKVKGPLEEPPGDDITVINPDGTIDEPEPEPPEPGGDIPDWHLPDGNVIPDGDGGYTFDWDFQLPDLNIDWSIHGLNTKFPLSIPWDVYNLCSTLNADPVAPELSGAIDLKIYVWEFDWDLSQFDTVAAILRTMETLVFVIGLAMITRNIIKG